MDVVDDVPHFVLPHFRDVVASTQEIGRGVNEVQVVTGGGQVLDCQSLPVSGEAFFVEFVESYSFEWLCWFQFKREITRESDPDHFNAFHSLSPFS